MRTVDWLTLLVSLVGIILLPIAFYVVRNARISGRNEEKLDNLIEEEKDSRKDISNLIDKLDARLRWIEERIWGTDPRFPRRRGRGQ